MWFLQTLSFQEKSECPIIWGMETKPNKFTYEALLFLSTHEQFYPVDALELGKFSHCLSVAHFTFPLETFPEQMRMTDSVDA